MRILPLGIGDAFSADYYSSCLAVEAENTWLMIDCPHPIRKMLKEASQQSGLELDIGDFAGLFLTHLHADHCSGLEGYGYFSYFVLQQCAKLISHRHVKRNLWDSCLAAGMEKLILNGKRHDLELETYFDWIEIRENQPLEFGPFTIECRKTIHHIPTTALKISAGGKTLAYSADTAFDESLIKWLSQGDLIIHETNLGIHTPYDSLLGLDPEIKAKMRLIHAPDQFDRENSEIKCLKQGQLVEI